jgi:hypothetical protein
MSSSGTLRRIEEREEVSDENVTKPTIETILERIDALGVRMDHRFSALEQVIAGFDVRLERVESVVNATRSEMLTLRADFKEFSRSHKEPA